MKDIRIERLYFLCKFLVKDRMYLFGYVVVIKELFLIFNLMVLWCNKMLRKILN